MQLDALRGGSLTAPGTNRQFDAKTFDDEVARLEKLEKRPELAEQQAAIAGINARVPTLVAAEPGYAARFGSGVLDVIDSPETWALAALAFASNGTLSAAMLGARATTAARLVELAKQAAISPLTAQRFASAGASFAVGTSLDGAMMHTGLAAFDNLIGDADHVDMSPAAFAQSIAFLSLSNLAQARHLARVAESTPGLTRAVLELALLARG